MSRINILLVDDDSAVNFLNKYMLNQSKLPFDISIAQHGQEALDYIANSNTCPDIIFLDINMPVLDGFGFLKRLKAAGKCYDQTKVYMLTSSLRESDREQAMSYECVVDYLEKPLTDEAINKIFK